MSPIFQAFLSNIIPSLIALIAFISASLFIVYVFIFSLKKVFKSLSLDSSYGYYPRGNTLKDHFDFYQFSKNKRSQQSSTDYSILDKETGELIDERDFFGDSFYAYDPLDHMNKTAHEFCQDSILTKSECNDVISEFDKRYQVYYLDKPAETFYKKSHLSGYSSPIDSRKNNRNKRF